MNDTQNKIKNTIRRAVISRAGDDSGAYHVTQITYNKKTVPAEVVNPYGLYTNPPNDLQTLVFTVCGDSENRAIIAYSQDDRFKDLKEGEVVVGNPKTQTFIKLKEDGSIEIDSKSAINITVNGDVKVKANKVELDALVDLGTGLPLPIARVGDAVQVNLGTGAGTITTGGINKSL